MTQLCESECGTFHSEPFVRLLNKCRLGPPAAFSFFLKFHGAGADVLRAIGNAEEGTVSASLLERGYGWRLCCQFLSHTITSYIFVTNIFVEIAPSLRCS